MAGQQELVLEVGSREWAERRALRWVANLLAPEKLAQVEMDIWLNEMRLVAGDGGELDEKSLVHSREDIEKANIMVERIVDLVGSDELKLTYVNSYYSDPTIETIAMEQRELRGFVGAMLLRVEERLREEGSGEAQDWRVLKHWDEAWKGYHKSDVYKVPDEIGWDLVDGVMITDDVELRVDLMHLFRAGDRVVRVRVDGYTHDNAQGTREAERTRRDELAAAVEVMGDGVDLFAAGKFNPKVDGGVLLVRHACVRVMTSTREAMANVNEVLLSGEFEEVDPDDMGVDLVEGDWKQYFPDDEKVVALRHKSGNYVLLAGRYEMDLERYGWVGVMSKEYQAKRIQQRGELMEGVLRPHIQELINRARTGEPFDLSNASHLWWLSTFLYNAGIRNYDDEEIRHYGWMVYWGMVEL